MALCASASTWGDSAGYGHHDRLKQKMIDHLEVIIPDMISDLWEVSPGAPSPSRLTAYVLDSVICLFELHRSMSARAYIRHCEVHLLAASNF